MIRKYSYLFILAAFVIVFSLGTPRVQAGFSSTSGTTGQSHAFTQTAGSNRIVVVSISWESTGNQTDTVTSITYGGNNPSGSTAKAMNADGQPITQYVVNYFWLEVALPADGSRTATFTINNPGGGAQGYRTQVTQFNNMAQVVPSGSATASENDQSVDVTVASANSTVFMAAVHNTGAVDATVDGSFASGDEKWDVDTGDTRTLGAAKDSVSAGSFTGSWTGVVTRPATTMAVMGPADTTAPTITSISSDKAAGTYSVGEVIDIDVTFSEAVTSTGNVTVTLETGDADRTCTFTVSNSASGTCNYTVQAGDTSADLDATVSGTIADQSSNAMSNFTPTTGLAANEALVIDTTAPIVTNTSSASLSNTTSATLSLTTNETATCKYGTTPNTAYGSIANTFSSTNSTTHSTSVTVGAGSNVYYVRCIDSVSNANTSDLTITITVTVSTTSTNSSAKRQFSKPVAYTPEQVHIIKLSLYSKLLSTLQSYLKILKTTGGGM